MDHSDNFEIVTLKNGIKSLRSLIHKETFHPVTGPWVEANHLHVQQQRLIERCGEVKKFVIWDVGFGAAANILAAIEALQLSPKIQQAQPEIQIHSFDKSTGPIEFALKNSQDLSYLLPHHAILQALLEKKQVSISPLITWQLHLGDFQETMKSPSLSAPHSIFYDPYSAIGNSEMWTLEHFSALRRCLDPTIPCLLTNYTRSTALRVSLLMAGFSVGIGCEVGEKAETTLATNHLNLLEKPLPVDWLKRVRLSSNSAPLRGKSYSQGPISDTDFEELQGHPQFLS